MPDLAILFQVLQFVAHHDESRAHQSLSGNAPEPRKIAAIGEVTAKPVLGGLHCSYSRSAA